MNPNLTARQQMLAVQPCHADDAELSTLRQRTRGLLARNHTGPEAFSERQALLQQLFAAFGQGSVVTPSFQCDDGFNISAGRNAFFKFGCVKRDCNRIDIGDDVLFGRGVSIGGNTVVGTGSVVLQDLPSGVLAVGNPCRVVRSLKS